MDRIVNIANRCNHRADRPAVLRGLTTTGTKTTTTT